LAAEKPATKMGQVRWAWPEIQAALAAGHTLQSIHKRLNEGGIEIDYRTLSLYIGRLERQKARRRPPTPAATPGAGKTNSSPGPALTVVGKAASDPFANIRSEREKKKNKGFEYHPFSTNKNLLE
jgi:hypothetical protein